MAALLSLERGDHAKAAAEVDVLRQVHQTKAVRPPAGAAPGGSAGPLVMCDGAGTEGLKLLKRTVEKTKDDYYHHAWGGGAYFMEAWGIGALDAGNAAKPRRKRFSRRLAHDSGSVRGALGMEAPVRPHRADRRGSARLRHLARRLWSKADPVDFEALRDDMTRRADAHPRGLDCRGRRFAMRPRRERCVFVIRVRGLYNLVSPFSFCRQSRRNPVSPVRRSGQRPGPYSFLVASGPERGQPTCYVCETAEKPAVIVFARSLSDPLAKLLRHCDEAIAARPKDAMRGWMTVLGEKTVGLDDLGKWAKQSWIEGRPRRACLTTRSARPATRSPRTRTSR